MVLNLRRLSEKSSRSSTGSQDLTLPLPEEIPSPLDVRSSISSDDSASERENRRRSLRKSSGSQKSQMLHPSPSRDSVATATGESLWTESSGSTVPGPGVIAGRVIKAIGNVAVLGIDNMIIKRRMATYRTIFPHGRYVDRTEDDGSEMYSEILEFTRPGFYPPSIRKDALDLLMIQINIRETHQLMHALDKYFNYEDSRDFLSQLLDLDTEAQKASANTGTSEEAKFLASIHLAIFIFRLSLSQRKSHQVAVNSFLLGMCSMKSPLADHLLRIFKFGQDSDYLDSLEDCPAEERQTLWKVVAYLRPGELPYLEERFQSRLARIDEILKQDPVTVDLRSVCYDLIEFSRNGLEHLMPNIRVWAYSRIFTFLARGGAFWEALISTLARVPHGDQHRIMSRILYCTLPALNLSPGRLDRELVGAYLDAMHPVYSPYDESHLFDLFFRFVIQAFSTQGSLRTALMLDQHFVSIIILCLAPPPLPSTSDELLRLITQTSVTR